MAEISWKNVLNWKKSTILLNKTPKDKNLEGVKDYNELDDLRYVVNLYIITVQFESRLFHSMPNWIGNMFSL